MVELQKRIAAALGTEPFLASLATVTEDGKPWVRYVMPTLAPDLTLRFSTHAQSRKVAQIRKNPEVHVTCGVTSYETARQYVQIQGRATLGTDAAERRAAWRPEMTRYFKGPDDPNFTIVIIRPYRIELQPMDSMVPEVWHS